MVELTLPYPPSVNHYWRRVGSKTLVSRAGRRFREDVGRILIEAVVETISGLLCLDILIHPQTPVGHVLKA